MMGLFSRKPKKADINWTAVTRIDVARIPTPVVETFWIFLFSADAILFEIQDADPRYEEFKEALFLKWPEIQKSFTAIFCGSPNIEERATLWQQRESY